jgi:hypothetical protein
LCASSLLAAFGFAATTVDSVTPTGSAIVRAGATTSTYISWSGRIRTTERLVTSGGKNCEGSIFLSITSTIEILPRKYAVRYRGGALETFVAWRRVGTPLVRASGLATCRYPESAAAETARVAGAHVTDAAAATGVLDVLVYPAERKLEIVPEPYGSAAYTAAHVSHTRVVDSQTFTFDDDEQLFSAHGLPRLEYRPRQDPARDYRATLAVPTPRTYRSLNASFTRKIARDTGAKGFGDSPVTTISPYGHIAFATNAQTLTYSERVDSTLSGRLSFVRVGEATLYQCRHVSHVLEPDRVLRGRLTLRYVAECQYFPGPRPGAGAASVAIDVLQRTGGTWRKVGVARGSAPGSGIWVVSAWTVVPCTSGTTSAYRLDVRARVGTLREHRWSVGPTVVPCL